MAEIHLSISHDAGIASAMVVAEGAARPPADVLMRIAHDVDDVRKAEQALLDVLPDGALMERAATGLATVCLRLLAERTGRVYGSRVVLLVGSGQQRRGRARGRCPAARAGASRSTRCCSPSSRTPPGSEPCCAPVGAGPPTRRARWATPTWSSTASSGSVVGAHCGPRPYACSRRVGPTAIVVAVDVPSGVDASTGTRRRARPCAPTSP